MLDSPAVSDAMADKQNGEKKYRIRRERTFGIEARLILLGQARNVEIRREGLRGCLAGTFCPALIDYCLFFEKVVQV